MGGHWPAVRILYTGGGKGAVGIVLVYISGKRQAVSLSLSVSGKRISPHNRNREPQPQP